VNFSRTKDYALVYGILTMKDVYEHMGDDYIGRPEDFTVNRHPDIVYVTACGARGLVGLFSLFPRNRVCWELHACMLPDASTQDKWQAARDLPGWLREHTGCRRLVAEVPRTNAPAIYYGTHGIGMKYVGTHRAAFQKHGKLQDLIILGMEVGLNCVEPPAVINRTLRLPGEGRGGSFNGAGAMCAPLRG
jgi:hypothetical protein